MGLYSQVSVHRIMLLNREHVKGKAMKIHLCKDGRLIWGFKNLKGSKYLVIFNTWKVMDFFWSCISTQNIFFPNRMPQMTKAPKNKQDYTSCNQVFTKVTAHLFTVNKRGTLLPCINNVVRNNSKTNHSF